MALPTSEPAIRALEAKCESRAAADSTRTVVQLAALPLSTRKAYLFAFEDLDLSNLIRCALEADVSADARLVEGRTPVLVRAALHNHARALKALLAGGANHALKNDEGFTALVAAVNLGNVDCARLLVAAGASANVQDSVGNTPLMSALHKKNADLVRLLLPVSDLAFVNSQQGYAALHVAVLASSVECLELVLSCVSDVDMRTTHGERRRRTKEEQNKINFDATALQLSCEKGKADMAEALLRHGASRVTGNSMQSTPLHSAAVGGSLACVALLVGAPGDLRMTPAEVNAPEEQGLTPLHVSAHEGSVEICSALIAAGARLDAKDIEGGTPIMYAKKYHPTNKALHALLAAKQAPLRFEPIVPPPEAPATPPQPLAPAPPAPTTRPAKPLPVKESELRALDAKCADPDSDAAQAAERQLKALPPVGKKLHVQKFADFDCGNLMRMLLAAGAPADAVSGPKATPALTWVASKGHAAALKALLEGGANPSLANAEGDTALHMAATNGSRLCVDLLLAAGADAGATTHASGFTPLMSAIVEVKADCVAALLERSPLDTVSTQGQCAIHLCALSGSDEILQLLLPRVGNVSVGTSRPRKGDPISRITALHIACRSEGRHALVSSLLAAGASRTATDSHGETPLHYAAKACCPTTLALLLGPPEAPAMAAADVNCVASWQGKTALMLAVCSSRLVIVDDDKGGRTVVDTISAEMDANRPECVRLLLAAGATDSVWVDAKGTSLIMLAIQKRETELVRALLPASDLSVVDDQGLNAVHHCLLSGNMEAFQLLLPHVRDVDARTAEAVAEGSQGKVPHMRSCLHVAASLGMADAVAALLERGASRTAQDSNGSTALHLASARGHLSCASLLVGRAGCPKMTPVEVETLNALGNTALHLAAYNARLSICGMLIAAGARLYTPSRSGRTPLEVALERYPDNKALLALLSGQVAPTKLPGTICDRCGGAAAVFCAACGGAVYCGAACMEAAQTEHGEVCAARQAAAIKQRGE